MFNISKLCKNVHKLGHKYRSTHKVKQTYNKDPRQNTNKKGLHRFPKKAATHPTFFWDGTSGGIHAGIQEHQTMFRSKLRVKLPVMSPWTFPSSVRPSSPQSSVAKVHPTMHGYLYWRHRFCLPGKSQFFTSWLLAKMLTLVLKVRLSRRAIFVGTLMVKATAHSLWCPAP